MEVVKRTIVEQTLQRLSGNKITLGYAGQNGMQYVPIGKFLTDFIPMEKMSLQSIEKYLRTLNKTELYRFLSKNPSYVFFKKLNSAPLTTIGAEVVTGRTLAVDPKYFPLGAIGLLKFPLLKQKGESIEISETVYQTRLVVNQDTGGAIKGPGRADLFWGIGKKAKLFAGHMRHKAYLYYFAPKENYLAQLKAKQFKCQ